MTTRDGSKRRPGRFGRMAAALVLGGALCACGGQAAPKAAPTSSTSSPAAATKPQSGSHSSAGAPGGSQQLTPISIQVPTPEYPYQYLFVAQQQGLFKKYGLKAQIITMKPPAAIPAVEKGELTFISTIGSAARANEQGQLVKIVAVTQNHPTFGMLGGPGITSISQLKGKVVSASAPAETITAMAVTLLQAHGLKRGSYRLINTGNSPAAQEAVLSRGLAQAAMFSMEQVVTIHKSKGWTVLGTTLNQVDMPFNGLATSEAEIRDHPALVRRTIQAVLDAVRICATQPKVVEAVMEHSFRMSPALAKTLDQESQSIWNLNGRPTAAGLRTEFQLDQQYMHLKHAPTEAQIYDLSLLPASKG